MKFYYQLESIDCGPACMAMIFNFHGVHCSVKQIKNACSITRMGVSVKDIVDGSKKMGFEATAVKLSINQLNEVNLPIILFWKQDHFVVLYKITTNKNQLIYHLADPGYGKIKIDSETIQNEWMGTNPKGIAILIEKTDIPINLIPLPPIRFLSTEISKNIFAFLKNNKLKYVISIACLLIGLIANWVLPVLFKKTIDEGILGKSIHLVWVLLIAQFTLFLSSFIAELISDIVLTKLNLHLSVLLKKNFLFKLMKLPISYFDTRLNSDTLQRLGDQSKIQSFLTWKGLGFLINILNVLVFSVLLFMLNKIIFFIFLTLSILSISWVSYFLKLRAILEYALFLRQSENSNSLYEFIMNMPEIKINGAQNNAINKLIKIQQKLNILDLKSLYLNIYQLIGANFMSQLKEIVSIAVCAYLIINNQMTIGTLLSISYILGQLNGPILNFVHNIRDVQDANIAQKRINDVYLEEDENNAFKIKLTTEINEIKIDNISFKYPGSFNNFVLNNIGFNIPKNSITAIVGTSGSGKTTLLKLLLCYYKISVGNIFLNDTLLNEIDADDWRNKCGIVLQDGNIFAGTIAHNIAIADENVDNEKLIFAAKLACLHEFIETLPMGYNTKVGNVGIQLSGGQKQRLLIARAIYKNPQFIFLDEATSSLDANNEKQIMENLNSFFTNKTVIVVAHRLSTVKNAHQIIVLEKGRIVEVGSHEQLIINKNYYYNLIKNQLELGN